MNKQLRGHKIATGKPDLVGRDAALARVVACMERAIEGGESLALIEGEVGMGKTRIVEEVQAQARKSGFLVLDGSAGEHDRARPFAAISEALERVPHSAASQQTALRKLIRGHLGEGDGPAIGSPHSVIDGWIALLEELVVKQPVVFIIDDLHWADPSTLLALRSTVHRAQHLPIALVCTLRPHPDSPDLVRALEDLNARGAVRIALNPLRRCAVRDLVENVVSGRPGPLLQAQLDGSGGNPFFIVELLRALVQDTAITVTDGVAEIREGFTSPSLRLTLFRSIGHLGKEATRVLRIASILGRRFAAADLSVVSGLSALALMPLLEGAERAGILETTPSGLLGFRHELLRMAIYTDLAPSLRTALHQQAGRSLADAGAPIRSVATQIVLGAEPGDTQAVAWLRDQAMAAFAHTPLLALELAGHGLEIATPSDPSRCDLTILKVNSLLWCGDAQAALSTSLDAARDPWLDGQARARLRLPLGWSLLRTGRTREGLDELRMARQEAREPVESAPIAVATAHGRLSCGDVGGAQAMAEEAIAGAGLTADPTTLAAGLCMLSRIALQEARISSAVALADRAVAAQTAASPLARPRWPAYLALGSALVQADRFADAQAALWRGERFSYESGRLQLVAAYHTKAAEIKLLAGGWDDALAELEAGRRIAQEAPFAIEEQPEACAWRALIPLHRNDLTGAEHALAGYTDARPPPVFSLGEAHLLWVRALYEEARDNRCVALAILEELWSSGMVCARPAAGPQFARLLRAAGRRGDALSMAAEAEAAAETMGTAWARAAALRCRGLAAGLKEPLVEAVTLLRTIGRPLDLAAACEDAGRILTTTTTHRSHGLVLLDEAIMRYDALGASRDAARGRSTMRSLGVPRGRRAAPRVPRHSQGWESLTSTEATVASMVVGGLTSPQIAERLFVSRRTVETHVAHVFRKLEIRSRTELKRAASSRTKERPAPRTEARSAPATR